jgi:hypothetical protein
VPPGGCAGTRHSSTPFGWRDWTRVACHSSISSWEAGSARVEAHSSGAATPAVADFEASRANLPLLLESFIGRSLALPCGRRVLVAPRGHGVVLAGQSLAV